MNHYLIFIFGLIVGLPAGMILFALLTVAKKQDWENDRWYQKIREEMLLEDRKIGNARK